MLLVVESGFLVTGCDGPQQVKHVQIEQLVRKLGVILQDPSRRVLSVFEPPTSL